MQNNGSENVAIFWDYENCPAPSNISGYEIVKGIRSLAQLYGSVKLFKAYLEISSLESGLLTPRLLTLTSELQSSGVSLIHCPHNGRKDVADKMMLVDMLSHAIDNPAPTTIVLISGDRDFAYAISVLRLRRYHVVLITLANAHLSLTSQASVCHDWSSDILGVAHPSSPSTPGKEAKTCPRSPPVVRGLTSAINPPTSPLGSKSRNIPNSHEMNEVDIDLTNYILDKRQNNSKQHTEDDFHRGPSTVHFISSEPSTPYFRGGVQQLSLPSVMSTPRIELEGEAVPDDGLKTPVVTPRTPSRILENSSHPPMNPEILTPAPPSQGTVGGAKPIAPIRPDLPDFLRPASVASSTTAVVPVTVPPPKTEGWQVKIVPPQFRTLVNTLELHRSKGFPRPFRSGIAFELAQKDHMVYKKAGVERFGQYATLAEKEGIVALGGKEGGAWIGLRPEWYGAITFLRRNSIDTEEPAIPPALHNRGSCGIHGEAPNWQHLIETLSCLQSIVGERLLRSRVGLELVSRKATVYRDAGVKSFAEYVSLAQTKGIVHLGGIDGHAWIRLDPCYAQAK
ncbi:uncharacterized protein LACBIDRAFT_315902 [Laccaria bicolor S238N-H82]|uniref:Predicted protein n=1 Tax=Laccaria bicolor (strain S238N-H82 / ATCC MYA-4686) TaxID=486041 RepID=B0D3G0_LACBS|nr:uncharacterized protein LACBIDRAFT_315902 [Laccaria bicolor S238N-H82]EDR10914.1 predicted protein [Laccaria bicolor S238N-H82]|eukprot:XP_001878215.1 predicted protein [Laccaria bicolor S238N-H82]